MNSLERKMVAVLTDLRENHHVNGVKAEFEAEGTRLEEAMRLKEVVSAAGIGLTIKIGGCEALRDMYECRVLGVARIVAPMIESAYALPQVHRRRQARVPRGGAATGRLRDQRRDHQRPRRLRRDARAARGRRTGRHRARPRRHDRLAGPLAQRHQHQPAGHRDRRSLFTKAKARRPGDCAWRRRLRRDAPVHRAGRRGAGRSLRDEEGHLPVPERQTRRRTPTRGSSRPSASN